MSSIASFFSPDPASPAGLSFEDRNILANVDACLARGIELFEWYKSAKASGAITDRFELNQVFNRPEEGFAFFADADLPSSGTVPVMGDVPTLFYDQPKGDQELAVWTREVEVFALRYFMRISDFRLPQVVIDEDTPQPPGPLLYLSLCPRGFVTREGFGFEQLYFKERGSGKIGKFPPQERFAIVDARDLRTRYEWVVGKVRIFNFDLSLPLDTNLPRFSVPLLEDQYVILNDAFVTDEIDPEPGVRGLFSFGYAMLKPRHDHSVLAYGPGQFDLGFQVFNFEVGDDGTIRANLPFVVNRPTRILDVSLDPIDWAFKAADLMTFGKASELLEPLHSFADRLPLRPPGFDPVFTSITLANLFTLGQASKQLCISKRALEQFFLVFHFSQYYTTVTGSLLTWRQIGDWLDTANLPEFVKTGVSS